MTVFGGRVIDFDLTLLTVVKIRTDSDPTGTRLKAERVSGCCNIRMASGLDQRSTLTAVVEGITGHRSCSRNRCSAS